VLVITLASAASAQPAADLAQMRQAAVGGNLAAQCVLGQAYRTGVGTLQDYAQAVAWFHKAASKGNACSQFMLGLMHLRGEGVQRDEAEALQWFGKAAGQGLATAQLIVGRSYEGNFGVSQNYARAAEWYRKAAEQGLMDAQMALGLLYEKGLGVPQDFTQAVFWFRKGADEGDPYPMSALGRMYLKGSGVPQDSVEAHKWLNVASARATGDYQKELAEARDGPIAKGMTPGQIAEAQKRAREWMAAFETRTAAAAAVPLPPPPAPPEAIRVGGNIASPRKIKDVQPEYPAIAQSARVQGVVIIEATIGPDGKVQDATVMRSIPLLDAAALDAVKQWEFTPTLLNGVPAPVIMTLTVKFTLK
jgi:TonB family protein